jgi:hypothetical protein
MRYTAYSESESFVHSKCLSQERRTILLTCLSTSLEGEEGVVMDRNMTGNAFVCPSLLWRERLHCSDLKCVSFSLHPSIVLWVKRWDNFMSTCITLYFHVRSGSFNVCCTSMMKWDQHVFDIIYVFLIITALLACCQLHYVRHIWSHSV